MTNTEGFTQSDDATSAASGAPPALAEYRRRAEALSRVIDAVPSSEWASPSPCDGWDAAAVVQHIVDTQRDFLAGQDLWPGTSDHAPSGAAGRGEDGAGASGAADPAAAWRAHRATVEKLLADPAVAGHSYAGHFGPTTVGETMVSFYGFDLVVHRWDVAHATGVPDRLDDAELTELEQTVAALGDNLYQDGVCAPAVELGEGASRQDAVLAALGRDPRV